MYVYCAENVSMPGMVKIGMTEGTPAQRMYELSTNTSVPTTFECAWYAYSSNPSADERQLHEALKVHRVSKQREFFRCSAGYARSAAESMGLLVMDARQESTRSHALGRPHSEWIGAATFLVLFLLLMPVWNTGITWYYKPLICLVLPVVIGLSVQAYLMFKELI
jgi:hypothetical protein